MAAISNFYMTVNISSVVGTPTAATNPINAATFQIVTPWGSSDVCFSWQECLNQLMHQGGSPTSGRMGQFWAAQTGNGLTTSSQTVPLASNIWSTTP
jgi:hypothetical protein